MERLRDNDLFLKPTKCEFNKSKVEYLGMVIEEGKILMDSGKLKGIRDWSTPTTVKQVWAFLGFGNLYRWFIWHFSELAKPLNDLLKKDNKFEWTSDSQKSLWWIKKMLHWRACPNDAWSYLTIPNWNRCLHICYRSSSYPTWFKWWLTSHFIYVKNPLSNWKKLWNLRLRTAGDNSGTWGIPRICACDYHPFRS